MLSTNKSLRGWLLLALLSSLLLPWHLQEAGLWSGEWLQAGWTADAATAPAAWQLASVGRLELAPLVLLPLAAALLAWLPIRPRPWRGTALLLLGGGALAWLAWLGWGAAQPGTPAFGWGVLVFAGCALFTLSTGAA